jgi:probable HAF family extracellular repeat protein
MLSLPSLGGLVEVVGLNENGEVAGTIRIGAQQHAFVWTHDRGMVDLGIGPHGFDMAWIVDINDRGDILGYVGRCIKVDNFNYRCGDGAIPGALRWTQVRAILWRNTSH